MPQKNESGAWGEELAAKLLRRKHCRILERNYRIRGGEIDIIAENREFIIFAEVKTRKDAVHGEAKEFVTPAKQEKLRYTAAMWLSEHETGKQPRFDVIEVYAPDGIETKTPVLNHIENAF